MLSLLVKEREDALLKQGSQDGGSVEGADMRKLSLTESAEVAVNNHTSSKVSPSSEELLCM